MMRLLLGLIVVGGVAAYLLSGPEWALLSNWVAGPDGLARGDMHELAALLAALALLVIVVPSLFGAYRGRVGGAIRDVVSWSAIGLILVAGYSYREELGQIAFRIAGELSPPGTSLGVEQRQTGERAVRIRKRGDGHFVARVSIDGAAVPMLVDTGASTIVLRQQDAKLLGVDLKRLKYSVPVQTANGLAYAAHAKLSEVAIGNIVLRNVDALVAQPGVLKESLLGMSFLSRLRSYEFAGEFLTFRN
jgi:aspartyl protease family protein